MVAGIVKELQAPPVPVEEAKAELPHAEGFYAWWIREASMPSVPRAPHPDEPWDLLYVGISPASATSSQTIRSRVRNNHIGGNTGSSTFRFSLASLLFEDKDWKPSRRKKKVVLEREDNTALSAWQAECMGLTWAEFERPWRDSVEEAVIAAMGPPMNLDGNYGHPFYTEMKDARDRFRAAAT